MESCLKMLIENLNKYKIILASASLRRQQLLNDLGIDFEIVIKDFDESFPCELQGSEIAKYVAESKAKAFADEIKVNELVITADTIVWCGGRVLGKPADAGEAAAMLRQISGRTHEVITGVSIMTYTKSIVFTESTKVSFRTMTDSEIFYYIEKFAPYDKAGAYGIQEWIGMAACNRIEGSYFNVVGLPVQRLYEELLKILT